MQAIWQASWIELFLNYLPCRHWESTHRTMRTASIYYIRVIRVKTDILWVSSPSTVADPRDHFSKPCGLSSSRWHLFFIWNTGSLRKTFQISWRSFSCFGFAGYKVTSFSMTYFERNLNHRDRLNCLRHNEGKKGMKLKKPAPIRKVFAPPLFDLVPLLGSKGGVVVTALNSHQCRSGWGPGVKVVCG